MPANYQTLADELTELATAADSAEHLMTMIVERLQDLLKHYNWVGFYMLDDRRRRAKSPCSCSAPMWAPRRRTSASR